MQCFEQETGVTESKIKAGKTGTRHFLVQRVTALVNVPLVLFLLCTLIANLDKDYAGVQAYLARPLVAILMLVFILSGFWHMKIGMGEIIEDYVYGRATKKLAGLLNLLFPLIVGAACIFAVVKISLGL